MHCNWWGLEEKQTGRDVESETEYYEVSENLDLTRIFWAPKSLQMVIAAMKLKDAYSLEGKLWPT